MTFRSEGRLLAHVVRTHTMLALCASASPDSHYKTSVWGNSYLVRFIPQLRGLEIAGAGGVKHISGT